MSVKVVGLEKAIKDIEAKGKRVEKAVIEVLSDTAAEIELDAKNLCPDSISDTKGNVTRLSTKQRITRKPEKNGLSWNVGINATEDFDAYLEFSTGLDAAQVLNGKGYTDEMRAIARGFYKNGKGTLMGKPFLFPSFIKNTANLVDEITKAINEASK